MMTLFWTILTYLSSPVLLLFAYKRKRDSVEKVLVIHLAMLGDLVAATPIFRAIKKQYPDVELHVLCRRNVSVAITDNPFVDHIHFDEGSRWKLLSRLRKERFDWSLGCMPTTLSAMAGVWACVPHRVHTTSAHRGILLKLFAPMSQDCIEYSLNTHTFDHYMRIVSCMGIKPISYQLDFTVPDSAVEEFAAWKSEQHLKDNYIVLNLTAGNAVKEWPLAHFVELANYCTDTLNRAVVFSTLDRDLLARARSMVQSPDRCFGASNLSLAAFGALCRNADAFVSVDTGPMYIAHACGCPVAIIVGPVPTTEQVPPESDRVSYVLPPADCTPWMHITKSPRSATPEQLRCIQETSVESVIAALKKVL